MAVMKIGYLGLHGRIACKDGTVYYANYTNKILVLDLLDKIVSFEITREAKIHAPYGLATNVKMASCFDVVRAFSLDKK